MAWFEFNSNLYCFALISAMNDIMETDTHCDSIVSHNGMMFNTTATTTGGKKCMIQMISLAI